MTDASIPGPPGRIDFDAEDRAVAADLKGRTVRGGLYTVGSQLLRVALQTGSVAVLGRLLTPDDFGLIALVGSLTGFMLLFRELGLPTATVQAKTLNHAQVNTIFWINVGMATLLAAITASLAPAAAWYFGDPRLTAVMIVLAGLFIVGGLTVQHKALLRRSLRIGVVQSWQVAGQTAGIVAAIALAWVGANYWALVASQVVSATVLMVGCWLASGWRPGWPGWGQGSGAMLRYGGELTATNLLTYWSKNLDNLLIGKVWGSASLGVYSKAYGLLLLPVQQFTRPMAAVVMPGLSRLQDDPPRFASLLYRAMHLLAFACLPTVVVLAWYADEVIRVVLGPQWTEAGPLFRVLAFAALCQPVSAGCTWLFLASGRTGAMLRFSVVQTLFVISGFALTVTSGPWWMALSFAVVNVALLLPQMLAATRNTPATVLGMVEALGGAAMGTALSALGLWGWTLIQPASWGPWTTTGLGFATAASIYLIFAALHGDLRQVLEVARQFRQTPNQPTRTATPTPVPAGTET